MAECINKCTPYEYENPLSPQPTESDLVQVYDSIEQITNPNSNHIYVVGNDTYVFDGTRFLHTNECNIPPYDGEYTVTAPSQGSLTLPTKDMLMTDDLTIEANHEIEDAMIQNTAMDEYYNDRITEVSAYKFFRTNFKIINLPNVTTTKNYSFGGDNLSLVEEIYLPRLTGYSGNFTWVGNPNLRILDIGKGSSVHNRMGNCTSLETLIIRNDETNVPSNENTFIGTPFAPDGTGGYVYVPQALLSQYQSNANWQQYANVLEFRAIEGSIYELEE